MKKRAVRRVEDILSDPEYIEAKKARDRELNLAHAKFIENQKPLTEELTRMGFQVESVIGMVKYKPHPIANAVLMKHLKRPYDDNVREMIALALSEKEAKPFWSDLVNEYQKAEKESRAKRGIASTLEALASSENLDEVIDLVLDSKNGTSRVTLVRVLRRSRNPKAKEVIESLRSDPEIGELVSELVGKPKISK